MNNGLVRRVVVLLSLLTLALAYPAWALSASAATPASCTEDLARLEPRNFKWLCKFVHQNAKGLDLIDQNGNSDAFMFLSSLDHFGLNSEHGPAYIISPSNTSRPVVIAHSAYAGKIFWVTEHPFLKTERYGTVHTPEGSARLKNLLNGASDFTLDNGDHYKWNFTTKKYMLDFDEDVHAAAYQALKNEITKIGQAELGTREGSDFIKDYGAVILKRAKQGKLELSQLASGTFLRGVDDTLDVPYYFFIPHDHNSPAFFFGTVNKKQLILELPYVNDWRNSPSGWPAYGLPEKIQRALTIEHAPPKNSIFIASNENIDYEELGLMRPLKFKRQWPWSKPTELYKTLFSHEVFETTDQQFIFAVKTVGFNFFVTSKTDFGEFSRILTEKDHDRVRYPDAPYTKFVHDCLYAFIKSGYVNFKNWNDLPKLEILAEGHSTRAPSKAFTVFRFSGQDYFYASANGKRQFGTYFSALLNDPKNKEFIKLFGSEITLSSGQLSPSQSTGLK